MPHLLLFCLLAASPETDLGPLIRQFVEVLAAVEQANAEAVPSERAIYGGAIPGMLRRLDPHSVFFDPDQFQQLKELETSTRKGFGSVVSVLPGRVVVLQALPGLPMARSGIEPGDEIVAVNGIELARLEVEQLVELLGQSRQSQVRLDVRRPGNARILQFVLTPEDVESPSVDRVFSLRPGVGYVRVANFDAKAAAEIRQAIETLGGPGLKGLVLDLRNNPGGIVTAALETAALFLKPGRRILSVRGRSAEAKEIHVPESAQPYDFPVSILVNSRSASAAEIVAGALQDHKRATIVGEPTFGKGLVQSVYPLSSGTGLALTTAFYYTPNGRSIQRPLTGGQLDAATTGGAGGIMPDIRVDPEPVTPLRAVLEATGSFTEFATEFLRARPGVTEQFEVPPSLVDDFRVYLSQRKIQPGVADWSRELDWIRHRLKTEIFNLSLGVEKGDEIEVQRDVQVRAALKALGAD